MEDFGFIIMRNIVSEQTSQYWRECVTCIRKFYNEKIIVIDDNSKIQNDLSKDEKEFDNILLTKSEIVGSGEVYGYYYAWKYRPFKKFMVIHDSMFLNKKVNFDDIIDVKFLWHFHTRFAFDEDRMKILFQNCDNNNDFYNMFNTKNKWHGCFGVCSVITLNFLDNLFDYFKFEKAIELVKSRNDRTCVERIFAVLCFVIHDDKEKMYSNPSIFGNIHDSKNAFHQTWNHYINKNYDTNSQCIKIWSGR